MNARDIIATTAVDGRHEPIGLIHAEAIIAMLTTSGYRILGPGELDAETLEAAAEAAEALRGPASNRWEGDSGWKPPHQDAIASAIRALKDKRDG